jgi:hypothetical protein
MTLFGWATQVEVVATIAALAWVLVIPMIVGMCRAFNPKFYRISNQDSRGEIRMTATLFWPLTVVTYVPFMTLYGIAYGITRSFIKTAQGCKFVFNMMRQGVKAAKEEQHQ